MDAEWNGKKNSILKYILISICFILGVVIYYAAETKSHDKESFERENYKLIDKDIQEYRGIVQKARLSNVLNGSLLIDLTNGEQIRIYNGTYNNKYKERKMKSFLSKNDSIYKPPNSDSIYVYRQGKQYYFILGKTIN